MTNPDPHHQCTHRRAYVVVDLDVLGDYCSRRVPQPRLARLAAVAAIIRCRPTVVHDGTRALVRLHVPEEVPHG